MKKYVLSDEVKDILHGTNASVFALAVLEYLFYGVEPYNPSHKWQELKKAIDAVNKKPKNKLFPFVESEYGNNFSKFLEDFEKTETYKNNPNILIMALYDSLMLSDPSKHKNSNWMLAAQRWYKNYPEKYHVSVVDVIKNDPAYGMMNKGDVISHAAKLKRQMQSETIKKDEQLPFN